MTASNDRRHRIQQYPIPMVRRAIGDMVYGAENQRIVTGLFVDGRTYEDVAASVPITTRGLYKRMDRIMPQVEEYLRKLN